MKNYIKKNVQPMRPYVVGEDMQGISVNVQDTPELGGMIAVNVNDPKDKWYIGKQFFEDNYIPVTEPAATLGNRVIEPILKQHTPTVIIPTIGRVVWFRVHPSVSDQFLPAMICYVHSPEIVNLGVLSKVGNGYNKQSVPLYQGPAETCPIGSCCWMPYQQKQAKLGE